MFNKIKQFFGGDDDKNNNSIVGKTLRGHYYIQKKLSHGGIGETFLGIDIDLPSQPKIVIKRILPQMKKDPVIIRLFHREAKILEKLGSKHNQIPKLYAYFIQNDEFYLVQEYIDGYNLTTEISSVLYTETSPTVQVNQGATNRRINQKKINENKVIELLKEILTVLEYVHQQGVIHRDIKPANLMRRKHDNKIILIDFGIVKEVSNIITNAQGQTIYNIKTRVGTNGYCPPEQAWGNPEFSSDIYAVGMVGIQALTGIAPHTLPKEKNEIKWRNFANCSNQIADFLDQMICFNCYERYQNAEEALNILSQIKTNKISSNNTTERTNQNNSSEVMIFEPRSFEEMPQVIQALREGRSVILNLTIMDPDEAQRGFDFVASATYAIDGHQERLGDSIWLFVPSDFEINTTPSGVEIKPKSETKNQVSHTPKPKAPVPAWAVDNSASEIVNKVSSKYKKLQELLASEKYLEANEETYRILNENENLSPHRIININCQTLLDIDNLWIKYSNGKFGFSVQREIYKNLMIQYDLKGQESWDILGQIINWKQNGTWLMYSDITFNSKAAKGHLPILCSTASSGKAKVISQDKQEERMLPDSYLGIMLFVIKDGLFDRLDFCNKSS